MLAVAALTGCRQKMAEQPYYRPLEESEFFYGGPLPGSSARPLVEGTVARGFLRDDVAMFTGYVNRLDEAGKQVREAVNEFPINITADVIKRGQNRYNVYCSPCHGFEGDGYGMIVQRGLQGPANFHSDRLTTAPVGHYFDVISNGFGRMFPMEHVPVRDRWAIIAYIRALQVSRSMTLEQLSAEDKEKVLAVQDLATTAVSVARKTPPQATAPAASHPNPSTPTGDNQ